MAPASNHYPIIVPITMPPPVQPPKPMPTTLDETHADNHQEKPTPIQTHTTHGKSKQNPKQTYSPTPISTPHLNTDLCAKLETSISTPPHWSATRERREIMSGWWLAMAGDSGSGHGVVSVVAMRFWVWREESRIREKRKIEKRKEIMRKIGERKLVGVFYKKYERDN